MQKILITGHSKGIGKYLYDRLQTKYDIFGFSRTNGFDLTKQETFEKIAQKVGSHQLDALILNAGVGTFGTFESIELQQYEYLLSLNLLAHIRLLKILENTISKNTTIIFIGSIISKKFMKGASVYQASKFGLRGLAGGLKHEGKKVFLINPKIVDTDFHKDKVDIQSSYPKTPLKDIFATIQNILQGKEKRFEIDL